MPQLLMIICLPNAVKRFMADLHRLEIKDSSSQNGKIPPFTKMRILLLWLLKRSQLMTDHERPRCSLKVKFFEFFWFLRKKSDLKWRKNESSCQTIRISSNFWSICSKSTQKSIKIALNIDILSVKFEFCGPAKFFWERLSANQRRADKAPKTSNLTNPLENVKIALRS